MRSLLFNKVDDITDDHVIFDDGLLYIISVKSDHFGTYDVKAELKVLDAEFDKPISLKDIAEQYPNVRKVIYEDMTKGYVYNYKNHANETWELVGETVGYA